MKGRLNIIGGVTHVRQSQAFVPRPLPERPGRVEAGLRALWTPKVKRRLWRPEHWRDLLELRRHYDVDELQPSELKLDFPVGRLPDCDACEDMCCTGAMRVVLLRLVDVAALVDAGLEGHISSDKPAFSAEELKTNTALHDMVNSEAWRCLPVLRQDDTRTCSLLTADNTCGAHPFWPLSCARFPYSLDIFNQRVFYARSCQSVQQDNTRVGRKREAALVDAVVDAYNQRLRDAVLLRVAQPELTELGLARFLQFPR